MGNSSSASAPVIPTKMRRFVLVEKNPDMEKVKMEIQEVETPVPKSGEVLVRVVAAPINPSDFGGFRFGKVDPEKPEYIGKEGSGIVVASGGGMKANGLVGQKVGITNMQNGGSYQEYVVVDAMRGAFPLPDDCPVEDGCSFFVNPYTAIGIVNTAKELGSPGFVHTGAASQLGQMLVKYCKEEKMTLINVVRREEQAEILRNLGAEHVVVSSKEGWKDELKKLVEEQKVTCGFDCVAGQSTGDMMECLPNKSTTYVYGGLSETPVAGLNVMDLIYRGKKLEGWFLPNYLKNVGGGSIGMAMRVNMVTKLVNPGLSNGWSSSKFVDAAPEEMWSKFLEMRNKRGEGGFTNQKLRLRWPQPEPPVAAAGSQQPAGCLTGASTNLIIGNVTTSGDDAKVSWTGGRGKLAVGPPRK